MPNHQKNIEVDTLRRQVMSALLFIMGFSTALIIIAIISSVGNSQSNVRDNSGSDKFKFISPLIFCKPGEGMENVNYSSFRFELEKYVNKSMRDNDVNHISVYFRDLNNGPWFGINENETFSPSSLLKLPLVISALKEMEDNDNYFLMKTITHESNKSPLVQNFKPIHALEIGKTYTLAELAERAIKYSDNESAILLSQALGKDKIYATYTNLGIPPPDNNGNIFMNVKEYATFFRILYNSSYLSKQNSEAALELLTSTSFNIGIRAGVPDPIVVAHKFGEKVLDQNKFQLHDCGIIYLPSKPYILCAMTQGSNFDELTNIIKNISDIVYRGIQEES